MIYENMKYTIGEVQQNKLMEHGLDIKDAFILSYLRDMTTWKNILEKNVKDEKYMWVDYSKLLSYLPALKINTKDVLTRRLKRYEDLGLIKRHLHKSLVYGSYNFIFLSTEFYSLFEFTKIEDTKDEIDELKEKLGLLDQQNSEATQKSCGLAQENREATQKSCGFDSKVASTTTQKLPDNTTINILPIKDSSSRETKNPAAVPEDIFFKNLKELLNKNGFNFYNTQTLKNIRNYSNANLKEVEKVIKFMKLRNKTINSQILVAILKDKDHLAIIAEKSKVTKKDKVEHMLKITFENEINELVNQITKSLDFKEYKKLDEVEKRIVNTELERVLCKRYDKLQKKAM